MTEKAPQDQFDTSEIEFQMKVMEILHPYLGNKRKSIIEQKTRFVHYTSASNAISIIRNNCVWLRHSSVMNDFSEISHGHECLSVAWKENKSNGRLDNLFSRFKDDGIIANIEITYNGLAHSRDTNTYLVSISEHGSHELDEDRYGRLSMWRAYGGKTNVAMVVNNTPFLSYSDALDAYTTPVLYKDQEGFIEYFNNILDSMENNMETLLLIGASQFAQTFAYMLNSMSLSTKHPSFVEEREWRIIYSPKGDMNDRIIPSIETIDGVPQTIHKLLFKNYPEEGYLGATLPELINKIIIGPTEFPLVIFNSFLRELELVGIKNAAQLISVTNTPLRR